MDLKLISLILLIIGINFYLVWFLCITKVIKNEKIVNNTFLILVISAMFVSISVIITIFFVPADIQFESVNISDKYDCLRYQCRYGYDYHIVGENGVTYLTDDKIIYHNLSVGNIYNFTVGSNYNNVVHLKSVN